MGTIVKAPIGVEDQNFKDSGTSRATFTRTDSNSRTLTLNKLDATDIQWRAVAQTIENIITKGADIASANALTLGTDGNYFDVTGTTTITSIGTIKIGFIVRLHFDGVLTVTHNATDLILPSGNNIVTQAGDELTFIEFATGDWRLIAANRPIDTKGADIASNAVLPVLAPGFFDVTGTTAITTIADIGIGSQVFLQFDGILTITHHATNLILPSGNNITTRAGDVFEFIQYATGDWLMVASRRITDVKLADVASTAALPVLGSGFMDVTGTTTITTIADIGIGSKVILQFDGALTITHHATNLILPFSANIKTIAGDVFTFVQYAAGDWILISESRPLIPWYDSRADTDLATAVAAIGATETSLLISDSQAVTADLTIPSTLELVFLRGGELNISATKTVTINGQINSGRFKIFTGSGAVAFGAGLFHTVFPEWWGALADDSTDNTTAIQAAMDVHAEGGVVSFTEGVYRFTNLVINQAKLEPLILQGVGGAFFDGSNQSGTVLACVAASGTALSDANTNFHLTLKNFTMVDLNNNADAGIKFTGNSSFHVWENVNVYDFNKVNVYGVDLIDVNTVQMTDCEFGRNPNGFAFRILGTAGGVPGNMVFNSCVFGLVDPSDKTKRGLTIDSGAGVAVGFVFSGCVAAGSDNAIYLAGDIRNINYQGSVESNGMTLEEALIEINDGLIGATFDVHMNNHQAIAGNTANYGFKFNRVSGQIKNVKINPSVCVDFQTFANGGFFVNIDETKATGFQDVEITHPTFAVTTAGFIGYDNGAGAVDHDPTTFQGNGGFMKITRWDGYHAPITFTDSDATPAVSGGADGANDGGIYNTNTTAVTITFFDQGYVGQRIIVISKGAITYDVTGTNLKGGTVDLVTASGDLTQWYFDGTDWILMRFIDQSDDLS